MRTCHVVVGNFKENPKLLITLLYNYFILIRIILTKTWTLFQKRVCQLLLHPYIYIYFFFLWDVCTKEGRLAQLNFSA